jgi:nudix-type nucleoside diphosphatase (YffH/AdpP family)
MSATVARAALVSGDAATVLPYDPAADTVLLIEQFRFGPWARGDLRPWTLEPVAGRIDPGESPEEAVRREAREEAGIDLDRLEKVAAYYPSTGAVSEYVHSFVGFCDLSAQHGAVAGSDAEDEDILSHVIPFSRLMNLVATGEAENGPLLVSAYWLAANRDRLRGA